MAQAGEAKRTATRFLKLEGATLALGIMCTVAPMQFVSFLGRFRADNPGIEITLLEACRTSSASCVRRASWMWH
jgi:DNA-binding transcriptional LysR family regulator